VSVENVIYVIDSGKGEIYNKINSYTLPQIYKYADITNSDVVVVSEYSSNVVWDSRASEKFKTYYLIFYIFKLFEKSNYKNMLYVDLDVYIEDQSPNIFNLLKHGDFYIRAFNSDEKYEEWCSDTLKFKHNAVRSFMHIFLDVPYICTTLFCTGVILANKNSVSQLNKVIPDSNWKSYINNIGNNIIKRINTLTPDHFLYNTFINLDYSIEDMVFNFLYSKPHIKHNILSLFSFYQPIIGFDNLHFTLFYAEFFKKHGKLLTITPLDYKKWNNYINKDRDLQTDSYFRHFAGTSGKKLLINKI